MLRALRGLFMAGLALAWLFAPVDLALAANNATLVTPCASACLTLRSFDVGAGVQADGVVPVDLTGAAIYGTAGAANANVITVQGIASGVAQPVSGTFWQATQPISAASLPLPTGAALEAGNLATIAGAITAAVQQSNEKQINGVVPLMGNGVTGTGSQRVTISSDNTAFAVNAASTLNAETTKVIGTVRNVGNAGAIFDGVIGAATAPANMQLGGAVYNSSPLTLTTGQSAALQGDANGWLNVHIQAGAGSGGTASTFGSAFPTTGTALGVSDGTNMVALKASSNYGTSPGAIPVLSVNANVTNGYAPGQTTMSASSPVTLASDQSALKIGGQAANGATAVGNPILDGGVAQSAEAVVTAGQQASLVTDLARKLIVLPYANPENFVSGVISSAMTSTTSTSLIAAPAAGLRNYLTQCTFSNSHATVGTDMLIQDGSGGTTLYLAPAAAVFGGATLTFPTPLRQPTTATAIFIQNVTTGANTKAACSGYKGA